MDNIPGMLNALLIVTERCEWPPEIDIAEQLGHKPHMLYATRHLVLKMIIKLIQDIMMQVSQMRHFTLFFVIQ